jgi:hypothetical protein
MALAPVRIWENAAEELRAKLSEFKGHRLVSLRVWWTPDEGATWRPSKSGFALRVDALPDLLAGLTTLEAEAQRMGWLADSGERRPGKAPRTRTDAPTRTHPSRRKT